MCFSLYKTRLKCLFRNRPNMFWCYIFPIVLLTSYYFAFGNLWSANNLKTINIAYVQDTLASDPLKEVLEKAEIDEDNPLFNIRYTNKEEASNLLENGEIKAYIVSGEEPVLYVKSNGINETIIKSILDSYRNASATFQTILVKQPDAIEKGLLNDVIDIKSFLVEEDSDSTPNAYIIYYFSLLAFVCIFAANWGLDEVKNIQANRSAIGARVNAAPIGKMKLLLINMMAAFTAHCGSVILMLIYMLKVLKIDFGTNMPYIALTCFIGSLAGIFLGAAVGVWVNKSYGIQSTILISLIMTFSFLSGMMFVDMKYIVLKSAPLLAYINPLNLVADSFYSLYYFDTFSRFYQNIAILGSISVILGGISYLGLRRKSYASI